VKQPQLRIRIIIKLNENSKKQHCVHITRENIKNNEADIPIVLDVYLTVCPPCAKLSPIKVKIPVHLHE